MSDQTEEADVAADEQTLTPNKLQRTPDERNLQQNPTFMLPRDVVRFLEQDERVPWETDHDYFQGLAACETLRLLLFDLHSKGLSVVYSSNYTFDKDVFAAPENSTLQRAQQLSNRLANLLGELDGKCEKMLSAMKRRPVIEKMLDKLKASDIDKKIFRCVLYSAVLVSGGMRFSDKRILSFLDVREIFASLGVSLATIMPLAEKASIWVKQMLYARAINTTDQLSAMDSYTLQVLMGLEISVEDFSKIGSNLLQNLLLEDEFFGRTATGKALKQQKEKERRETDQDNGTKNDFPVAASLAEALQSHSQATAKKGRILDVLSIAALRQQEVEGKALAKDKVVISERDKESIENGQDKSRDFNDFDLDEDGSETEDPVKQTEAQCGPYASDLKYLEDQVLLMDKEVEMIRLKNELASAAKGNETGRRRLNDLDDDLRFHLRETGRARPDPVLTREKRKEQLKRSLKKLREKIQMKLSATRREMVYTPLRLEQLCQALELGKFEKYCILTMVANVIMPGTHGPDTMPHGMVDPRNKSAVTVGYLIHLLCETLEEKMKSRRFFYKSSPMIQEGILTISQLDFMTDLSGCKVELDRRMFDFIVGLDTESSEIVEGSHLYMPNVNLDDVVLPQETKKRICEAVLNFEKVKDTFHRLEVDQKITYGLGQVLLFYGASGTGKTMLANAIATKLKTKVLLVNFPNLGTNQSGALIKLLFRESRINKSLLFFDECEALFKAREKGGTSVNMILTELERYDGLCILATNRAYDLDEAMHRRISLAVEFRKPDHIMRKEIWESLRPPKLPLDENVNLGLLAQKFELTGGLIKNAWLQSVSLMIQRSGDKVNHDDLTQASSEQVIGQLSMAEFDRRVVPTCGLDSIVLKPSIMEALNGIVHYSKAQSVLFGQWGFDKIHRSTTGISALFTGPPGVGKTLAAEAIGFDLGRPLMVVNVAELVSKWVGETGKNIDAVFADAKKRDAVLVFDEAEGMFASREIQGSTSGSRHDNLNVGILLQHMETFNGVCIAITNTKDAIDEAFFRRFRFVLEFEMPDRDERERIWKAMVPKNCPLAEDVSLGTLASRYEMMNGGSIKNALFRAATTAALRLDPSDRVVSMRDLDKACAAEMSKKGGPLAGTMLGMYN